jgi:heptaprenyl diphosphate synthase
MARYALLTALAMVLSWLESLVPLPVVPGVKLGLPNLAVIFALYRMGLRAAAAVSLARVGLVSMTFGNAYSFAYSLAGAALSLAVMALLRRTGRFSILGVSVAGGVSHNIAQILVAVAALGTGRLAWYLPALLVSGVAAGVAIGAVGGVLTERIKI